MADAALYVAPFLFNTMIVLMVLSVLLAIVSAILPAVARLRHRKP